MEKDDIRRAAEQAVNALQLDCQITDITRPLGKNIWCIQFAGSYGQFCDEFHDKEGKENSARVMREKIKRFFIKQRKPTRIVRGRAAATRRERTSRESNLLGTLLEAGEQVLKQASRITGEVIERTGTLNQAALKTGAEWVEGVSPTAADLMRPGDEDARTASPGPPPQREVEAVSHDTPQTLSRTIIPKRKPKARAAAKAAAKTPKPKRARAAKDSGTRAGKKGASKKSAAKGAAKKRGAKAARKAARKSRKGKSR